MRKKFEYKESTCRVSDLITFLNDQGQVGWEVVNMWYDGELAHVLFKREI